MKQYWPIMGAVGVAATIGLYAYVNRDPLYKEPKTEEKYLEEETEYETELSEDEIPVPYATPKTKKEKNPKKVRENHKKYNQKETKSKNKPYNQSLPEPSGLEETLEENEERPWYDLPLEEISKERLRDYFDAALKEKDFRAAERYASGLESPDLYRCVIAVEYYNYLNDVIEHCKNHDFSSVYRKTLWANVFFLQKYGEVISDEGSCRLNVSDLITTHTQEALEAIEYCHE